MADNNEIIIDALINNIADGTRKGATLSATAVLRAFDCGLVSNEEILRLAKAVSVREQKRQAEQKQG